MLWLQCLTYDSIAAFQILNVYRQFGQFDYSQSAPPPGDYGMEYGAESPYMAPQQDNPMYTGSIMTPDPVSAGYSGSGDPENFEDEPPLLEGVYNL